MVRDASLNKLAEFIGDVLQQLADLQSTMSQRITEIDKLEQRTTEAEARLLDLEGFNKYLKTRLRAAREQGI